MADDEGSLQTGDNHVFTSSVTTDHEISICIADTAQAKVIQAQSSQSVESTARKEAIDQSHHSNSLIESSDERLNKMPKASKCITLSYDEKGRETLSSNFCQTVLHVGCEEMTSSSGKKVMTTTPGVCSTIPEEEDEKEDHETPSRNVKPRTTVVEGTTDQGGGIGEEIASYLLGELRHSKRNKELLEKTKEAIKELFRARVKSDSVNP